MEELHLFILVFLFSLLWFGLIVDMLQEYIINNLILVFSIIFVVYSIIVCKYILNLNFDIRLYIAFMLCMFAADLFMFPMIIPKEEPFVAESLYPNQMMSVDYIIYILLPEQLPHIVRYFIVYPTFFVSLLFLARRLTTKREFNSIVKAGV